MSAYRDEMHPIAWEYICGHTEQRMVPANTVRVQDCDACPRGGCQEWIANWRYQLNERIRGMR